MIGFLTEGEIMWKRIMHFFGRHDYEQVFDYPTHWDGSSYIVKCKCSISEDAK